MTDRTKKQYDEEWNCTSKCQKLDYSTAHERTEGVLQSQEDGECGIPS